MRHTARNIICAMRICIIGVLTACSAAVWALQVAVTPAPVVSGNVEGPTRMRIVISRHLTDTLACIPGITVADEAWTMAVMAEMQEGT
jgi:hypothetical protein